MPFGRWTCGIQWHIVLDGGPWPPGEGDIWGQTPQPKKAIANCSPTVNHMLPPGEYKVRVVCVDLPQRFRLLPNHFGPCCVYLPCRVADDAKWLLVSTEELYGMTVNCAGRGKQLSRRHSLHHHNPNRLAPAPAAATVTSPAVPLVEPPPQCEVAFPGNRIFSPSPTDEVRVVVAVSYTHLTLPTILRV